VSLLGLKPHFFQITETHVTAEKTAQWLSWTKIQVRVFIDSTPCLPCHHPKNVSNNIIKFLLIKCVSERKTDEQETNNLLTV
jgi:hypothetical protein